MGQILVVAGILADREALARDALLRQGRMRLVERVSDGEWVMLVFERVGST